MKNFATTLFTFLLMQNLSAQVFLKPALLKGNLPGVISNNAVAGFGNKIYSFSGISNGLKYSAISNTCYSFNIANNTSQTLPSIPDSLPVIASSASTVKNRIYIIGGYHVAANGNEVSSNAVHRFDPLGDTFLTNGAPIPVAIDDQVQAVWMDSLIYVVTGWSNTTNMPNVQIYNPAINTWFAGTPVPNNNSFKAFGGFGCIYKDTIYYYGGATLGANFPLTNVLRKGVINPSNPSQISWSFETLNLPPLYRGIMIPYNASQIFMVGGAQKSYNYDALAYAGGAIVPNSNTQMQLASTTPATVQSVTGQTYPKDLRGYYATANGFYTLGGISADTVVSKEVLFYEFDAALGILNANNADLQVYPNPNNGDIFWVKGKKKDKITVYNLQGELVNCTILKADLVSIPTASWAKGVYFLMVERGGKLLFKEKLIVN